MIVRGRAVVVVMGAMAVGTGCQDTFELSVENRCGQVVEVAVETLAPSKIPDDHDPDYETSAPLLTTKIGDVSTRTTVATVWVRTEEAGRPVMFSVELEEVDPGRSDDDDVTIPIEGANCPP